MGKNPSFCGCKLGISTQFLPNPSAAIHSITHGEKVFTEVVPKIYQKIQKSSKKVLHCFRRCAI